MFCLYMCILMGKRLAVFLNSFLILQSFFWSKIQKSTFLGFLKFAFMWLQTGLSDLKNTKQLQFCLWWILRNFKMLHFFKIFEIF